MSLPAEVPGGIGVAVIDDHDAIHAGVQTWFAQAAPPVRLVASYTAVEPFLNEYPCATGDVDVVLLDLELKSRQPDFAAIEHVTAAGHRTLVYSHITHDEVILRCLDLGAAAYIAKTEGQSHLIEAIRATATDASYIGPRMASAISRDERAGRPALTKREKEVLIAWFQTESKELVGQRLYISASSVRTHLQRVRAKYAAVGRPAPTKAALVARAVQDGYISVEEL
jgi:DNA-binding NarL/FixJ family response regulator